MEVLERCRKTGVVPVVVLQEARLALPTADALAEGGVGIMEITLRTAAGLDSIKTISRERPDILVGAGTVITLEQCRQCVDNGAEFIVSPGFNAALVRWCVDNGVPVLPGCVTPTEIMAGLELGLTTFKFFPADVYGGLKGMKALSAPFGGVQFIPTGGVNGGNLEEYLKAPYVCACGGSWLCSKEDISRENFAGIRRLAAEAAAAVGRARG